MESGDDYFRIYSQFTQEENANLDVVWNWNSPQSKPKYKKREKQERPQHSPKFVVYHSSKNKKFDKLKEELESLSDQIMLDQQAHNENHMDVNISNTNELQGILRLNYPPTNSDIFNPSELLANDSMDEELLLCSQEAEKTLERTITLYPKNPCSSINHLINTRNNGLALKSPNDKSNNRYCNYVKHTNQEMPKSMNNIELKWETKYNHNLSKIADDSFDCIFQAFNDEDIDLLSQPVVETSQLPPLATHLQTIERTPNHHSHFVLKNNHQIAQTSVTTYTEQTVLPKIDLEKIEEKRLQALAKLESKKKQLTNRSDSFLQKRSFEEIEQQRIEALAKLEAKRKCQRSRSPESITKCTSVQIEQKRLEAKAKLELKKKQDVPQEPSSNDSPIKCSPEEIEKKRLQALAKREAKKKQDIIERKRLEALKRLEENKKKRTFNKTAFSNTICNR